MKKNQLSSEDQARVDHYLNQSTHQIDRKPFRPWLLLGAIVVVLTLLSLLSYAIAWWHRVV